MPRRVNRNLPDSRYVLPGSRGASTPLRFVGRPGPPHLRLREANDIPVSAALQTPASESPRCALRTVGDYRATIRFAKRISGSPFSPSAGMGAGSESMPRIEERSRECASGGRKIPARRMSRRSSEVRSSGSRAQRSSSASRSDRRIAYSRIDFQRAPSDIGKPDTAPAHSAKPRPGRAPPRHSRVFGTGE